MSTSSSRRSGGSRHAGSDPPYVVMVGQAGSGKSEIAKKLAHPDFVSSNGEGSLTQTSDLFWTYDKSMVICDVPEDHPGSPIFEGNIPLALALTFEPISLVLITVKAVNDIYTVLANIKMYCDGLSRVYYHLNRIVGVLLTDMDEISASEWDLNELNSLIDKELTLRQVKRIIISKRDNLCDGGIGSNLMRTREIREMCNEKYYLPLSLVLSDQFLTRGWEKKAIWRFKLLVDEFKDMADQFSFIWHQVESNSAINGAGVKKGDIMFEFRSWMKYRMFMANNKLADSQNFVFGDKTAESERIYLYSMENQVRHFIFDLKLETKKYLVECDVDPRRCPYCNEIWTKDIINDCDGNATCGTEKISSLVDYNMRDFKKLGYYAFQWDFASKLRIRPCSELTSRKCIDTRPIKIGCGRSIDWKEMPQVNLSKELMRAIEATFMTSTEPKEIVKKVVLKPTVTTYPEKIEQEPPNVAISFEPGKKDYFKRDHAIGIEKMSADQKDASKESNSSQEIKLDSEGHNLNAGGKENYVVFIGDVGVGKSTVVEKLTGKKIDRGDSKLSVTRTSSAHWSYDGTVIVSDTPGSNSIEDQLQHNEEIAAAFNYRPISRVFVVVKADTRIANVMRVVEKYSDRLLSLPDENIGVLVTHMDTVSWTPQDLKQRLTDEYGIECVLFCGKETPRETLMNEIRGVCGKAVSFTVHDRNFSELFKINNKMVKILKDTSKEIDGFTKLKEQFERLIEEDSTPSTSAFLSQFQSWLEGQIKEAEERLARSNNFTFEGDEAKERGYIANLSNQVRVIFNDISLLDIVNNCTSIGRGSGSEDYVFKWIDGDFGFTSGSRGRIEGETVQSMIPRTTPQMSKSNASETSTLVKRESLPPIESYNSNDHANYRSREQCGYSISGSSPRLKITSSSSRNSKTKSFAFDANDECQNADLKFAKSNYSGRSKNFFHANTKFEKHLPVKEIESMREGHDLSNNKGNRNEMPLLSFNVVVDQSNSGKDKCIYTLQLHDEDLKIVSKQILSDHVDENDKSTKVEPPSPFEPDEDWPPQPWKNFSLSFDTGQTENRLVSADHQERMDNIGSSSNIPTKRNRYTLKSKNKTDCCKGSNQTSKDKNTKKSNYSSWLPSFGISTNKSCENVNTKFNKQAVSNLDLKAELGVNHDGNELLEDGNFSINVVNKNPNTNVPSMSIIITPITNSKNETNNRAIRPNQNYSCSASRTCNLSATAKPRERSQNTSKTRQSTSRTWKERDFSRNEDFKEF